jgi:hypothetical protein
MLRIETVSPELLSVLRELMKMRSLQSFRLVGGTALSLQLGHRESIDIDVFTADQFSSEDICNELNEKFQKNLENLRQNPIMVMAIVNGVKLDIVNDKSAFVRGEIEEEGIRMAHLEDIIAMKIKMTCDPFAGRKTKKDLMDIATLLDKYTLKQMVNVFKEKYPIMAPFEESVITRIKDFSLAEATEMPKMHNGLTWENAKEKISKGFHDYFESIMRTREEKLKERNK